ncbi:hypothetical protein HaLaN_04292 [Haematococcus lacustris]|uniref:Uncharacterized protein n=1 Tax=Haematococcus lacustris TaxID=44745 RepID=A0A699Z1E2_HAELA|nr:hypothetical protein HaLaN_04292 [Haematococcus lacustris]
MVAIWDRNVMAPTHPYRGESQGPYRWVHLLLRQAGSGAGGSFHPIAPQRYDIVLMVLFGGATVSDIASWVGAEWRNASEEAAQCRGARAASDSKPAKTRFVVVVLWSAATEQSGEFRAAHIATAHASATYSSWPHTAAGSVLNRATLWLTAAA